MATFMAFALLSLTFAADLKQKLEGDGLLFHSIDFLGGSKTPGQFANYWYNNPDTSLYLSSFSYVNSARPNIAGRSGILIDPKHPDVKLHAIANMNGAFNSCCKHGFVGQTSNACAPLSGQFVREKQIVELACNGSFQYANDIYRSSWNGRQPARGFFDRNNMINKLKENERNVNLRSWSEIVASVPAHAIAGVIDFDNAPSATLDPTQRVEGLCREMRKKNPNIPCYRAQFGVITPLTPLATSPHVPMRPTPASRVPTQPTPASRVPTQPTPASRVPTQPTSAPPSIPPRVPEPTPTQRRSTPTLVICVITITIFCLLVFVFYIYLNSKKRKEKDYPAEEEKAEKDENEEDFALSVSSSSSLSIGSLTLRKRKSLTSMSFEEM